MECLDWSDLQRLTVTCQALRGLPALHLEIATWLRDLQVLRCLRCPPDLTRKISGSMRQHPLEYRIMEFQMGADNAPRLRARTFYEAFGDALWSGYVMEYEYHRDDSSFSFAELQTWGADELDDCYDLQEGKAYDNVGDTVENAKKKRRRQLECVSIFHKENTAPVPRLFYVRNKPYCGSCLDSLPLLRLHFGLEHVKLGYNNKDWLIPQEVDYDRGEDDNCPSLEDWGLQENEFCARVFFTKPQYDYAEMRFLGVGARSL